MFKKDINLFIYENRKKIIEMIYFNNDYWNFMIVLIDFNIEKQFIKLEKNVFNE